MSRPNRPKYDVSHAQAGPALNEQQRLPSWPSSVCHENPNKVDGGSHVMSTDNNSNSNSNSNNNREGKSTIGRSVGWNSTNVFGDGNVGVPCYRGMKGMDGMAVSTRDSATSSLSWSVPQPPRPQHPVASNEDGDDGGDEIDWSSVPLPLPLPSPQNPSAPTATTRDATGGNGMTATNTMTRTNAPASTFFPANISSPSPSHDEDLPSKSVTMGNTNNNYRYPDDTRNHRLDQDVPSNNRSNADMTHTSTATTLFASSAEDELRKQIESLTEQLRSKNDELFELSATLAAVEAEALHRASTAERDASQKVRLAEEQLRQVRREADLARASLLAARHSNSNKKKRKEHEGASPDEKKNGGTIASPSSAQKKWRGENDPIAGGALFPDESATVSAANTGPGDGSAAAGQGPGDSTGGKKKTPHSGGKKPVSTTSHSCTVAPTSSSTTPPTSASRTVTPPIGTTMSNLTTAAALSRDIMQGRRQKNTDVSTNLASHLLLHDKLSSLPPGIVLPPPPPRTLYGAENEPSPFTRGEIVDSTGDKSKKSSDWSRVCSVDKTRDGQHRCGERMQTTTTTAASRRKRSRNTRSDNHESRWYRNESIPSVQRRHQSDYESNQSEAEAVKARYLMEINGMNRDDTIVQSLLMRMAMPLSDVHNDFPVANLVKEIMKLLVSKFERGLWTQPAESDVLTAETNDEKDEPMEEAHVEDDDESKMEIETTTTTAAAAQVATMESKRDTSHEMKEGTKLSSVRCGNLHRPPSSTAVLKLVRLLRDILALSSGARKAARDWLCLSEFESSCRLDAKRAMMDTDSASITSPNQISSRIRITGNCVDTNRLLKAAAVDTKEAMCSTEMSALANESTKWEKRDRRTTCEKFIFSLTRLALDPVFDAAETVYEEREMVRSDEPVVSLLVTTAQQLAQRMRKETLDLVLILTWDAPVEHCGLHDDSNNRHNIWTLWFDALFPRYGLSFCSDRDTHYEEGGEEEHDIEEKQSGEGRTGNVQRTAEDNDCEQDEDARKNRGSSKSYRDLVSILECMSDSSFQHDCPRQKYLQKACSASSGEKTEDECGGTSGQSVDAASKKGRRTTQSSFRDLSSHEHWNQSQHSILAAKCSAVQFLVHFMSRSAYVRDRFFKTEQCNAANIPVSVGRRIIAAVLDELDGSILPTFTRSLQNTFRVPYSDDRDTTEAMLSLALAIVRLLATFVEAKKGILLLRTQMPVDDNGHGCLHASSGVAVMIDLLDVAVARTLRHQPGTSSSIRFLLNKILKDVMSFFYLLLRHIQKQTQKDEELSLLSLVSERREIFSSCCQLILHSKEMRQDTVVIDDDTKIHARMLLDEIDFDEEDEEALS